IGVGDVFVDGLGLNDLRSARLPTTIVDADVDGDPIDPRVEARSALKAREILVSANERLLHDIHGIVAISGQTHRDRQYLPVIAVEELTESPRISCLTPPNELVVVVSQITTSFGR